MWDVLFEPGRLTGAPNVVEWLAVGVGLILATFVAIGRKLWPGPPVPATHMAELAGAVIDKKDAEAIIAVVQENSEAIRANTEALHALARSLGVNSRRLEQNTEESRSSAGEIAELRTDIKDLTREMIRGKQ